MPEVKRTKTGLEWRLPSLDEAGIEGGEVNNFDNYLRSAGGVQRLSGQVILNDSNVVLDGANKRIIINDGTNNRIVIGEV